jgi:hypothetical protein
MTTNKIGQDANSDDRPNLQGTTYSTDELSPDLRNYLLRRHGIVDLDPIPTANDADPYNWPAWKVSVSLSYPY